jgi:hypothetical protein
MYIARYFLLADAARPTNNASAATLGCTHHATVMATATHAHTVDTSLVDSTSSWNIVPVPLLAFSRSAPHAAHTNQTCVIHPNLTSKQHAHGTLSPIRKRAVAGSLLQSTHTPALPVVAGLASIAYLQERECDLARRSATTHVRRLRYRHVRRRWHLLHGEQERMHARHRARESDKVAVPHVRSHQTPQRTHYEPHHNTYHTHHARAVAAVNHAQSRLATIAIPQYRTNLQ